MASSTLEYPAPAAPAPTRREEQLPLGGPLSAPPAQARLQGLENDLGTRNSQAAANHFATHWGQLTSGLDTNDPAAVDQFAGQYGVKRQVASINGVGALQDNKALLAAAADAYKNSPRYQAVLQADPAYAKLAGEQHNAAVGRRLGQNPYDVAAMQGAIDHLAGTTANEATDAGSRRVQATGQQTRDIGEGAMYSGQGKLSEAQAGRTTTLAPAEAAAIQSQANRTNMLAPAEAARTNSEAAVNQATAYNTRELTVPQVQTGMANAERTRALTPAEVASQNAAAQKTGAETGAINQETRLRPQIVAAAQALAGQDRSLEQRKTESEINKNNHTAEGLDISGGPTAAGPAGAPTAPAAAAVRAPGGMPPSLVGGIPVGGTVAPPLPTPQRRQLPDGRIIEIVGDQTFQVMPDGSKRPLRVTQ